jgi:hypothetical protein
MIWCDIWYIDKIYDKKRYDMLYDMIYDMIWSFVNCSWVDSLYSSPVDIYKKRYTGQHSETDYPEWNIYNTKDA